MLLADPLLLDCLCHDPPYAGRKSFSQRYLRPAMSLHNGVRYVEIIRLWALRSFIWQLQKNHLLASATASTDLMYCKVPATFSSSRRQSVPSSAKTPTILGLAIWHYAWQVQLADLDSYLKE